MLTLMLLRHAKAAVAEADEQDINRDLTPRGRRAAQAMGRFIEARGPKPELVLCSPARRARETWQLVARELSNAPPPTIDAKLYDFGDGSALLESLNRHGEERNTVLIVGHNPAIVELAVKLVRNGDLKLLAKLKSKYPTGALATIQFDSRSWLGIVGKGELKAFIRPKDLLTAI